MVHIEAAESRLMRRFTLGKQIPLDGAADGLDVPDGVGANIRLMYLANDRTTLHVAACQGRPDVVDLLLRSGADVDPRDRWGSTPLADAIYYKNYDVIKILEKCGSKLSAGLQG